MKGKKELEEKFRRIFDDSPIGIELYDRKGNLLEVNKASLNIFGISDIENISNYKFFEDPNTPENIKENLEFGKISRFEKIYDFDQIKNSNLYETSKSGRIFHDVLVSPLFLKGDKEFSHFLVQVQDITLKKLAEQKLKESEIKHRLAYNRTDFYKDLFAHDMNNILHNILSSIELYSRCQKYPEKLAKGDDLLSIIESQAKRGANLILNVQKLSKLEQTEFQTEKTDIYDHLEKAIKFVKESFQDRNLNILIEVKNENFHVRANELLLDVFENILINSVKYNNNNSVLINIIISKEIQDEKKYIKLQFLDNGIGIPDSQKKTIFHRSHSKDRTLKGMGIGLSLVKNIIYSYNGSIIVEDKERGDYTKGSNFIIYIPEAKESHSII